MYTQIDASAISTLGEAWKQAPQIVIEELTAATWQAEMLLQRETVELTPVGVGQAGGLRGSMQSQAPEVMSDTVIGVMGSPLAYAESVELGTRPHAVSVEGVLAIEDWVKHKLGISDKEAQRVADAVAWKIRMRGTPAVGMFHRALAYSQPQIGAIFQTAAGRIGNRLGVA